MSRSQITVLREKFERSSPGNGNSKLERALEEYMGKQEVQLLTVVPETETHARISEALQEAGTMLESLRSRYTRSSQERI
jgi:hypothetical protein